MNLQKLIFTENDCYKAGKKITPKGIMVHSTGANNPNLKRYVNPDDGKLGNNPNGNHWNRPGVSKCTHAFIGKLKDGSIATYQTLPWDHRGWHGGGSSNDTHIGFEICEDNLTDATYFTKVYQEAVELCAYLCKEYKFTEKDIICHSEGYKKGIASNHGDVMHWFPKHGKSMDTFRADVKALLTKETPVTKVTTLSKATGFDKALAGTYAVTASALNVRYGAGTLTKKMVTIPNGTKVKCYGYYSKYLSTKWLYIQFTYNGIQYTGFASFKYLKK